jgi:ABC-type Fe3+ transport system substrate-binding protein
MAKFDRGVTSMQRMTRRAALGTLATVGAGLVAACGSSAPAAPAKPAAATAAPSASGGTQSRWEQVVRDAGREGSVTMIGPVTQEIRVSLTEGFNRAYPDIAVEYTPGVLASLVPQLRAELDRGKLGYDLVISGSANLLENKDLFEPIPPLLLTDEAKDESKWQSSKGPGFKWDDQERQYVLQMSEWVSGYLLTNTRQVPPGTITTWQDLLKPEYKGKIAAHDPRGSGAGQAVASYLVYKLGEPFVLDLYKGQDVALTRDYAQIGDWIASGRYVAGIGQTSDRIEALRKENAPLSAYSLNDAPGQLSGGFSVVGAFRAASMPHPNAAIVFLNWLLTKDGQYALNLPQLQASLRQDVPRDYVPDYITPKPGVEYVDTYGEDFVPIRQRTGQQVAAIIGR